MNLKIWFLLYLWMNCTKKAERVWKPYLKLESKIETPDYRWCVQFLTQTCLTEIWDSFIIWPFLCWFLSQPVNRIVGVVVYFQIFWWTTIVLCSVCLLNLPSKWNIHKWCVRAEISTLLLLWLRLSQKYTKFKRSCFNEPNSLFWFWSKKKISKITKKI